MLATSGARKRALALILHIIRAASLARTGATRLVGHRARRVHRGVVRSASL